MKTNLTAIGGALSLALICGCATGAGGEGKKSDDADAKKAEAAIPKAQAPMLVALLDACPLGSAATPREALPFVGPLLAAAASAVITPLVNSGVAMVADWLDERALGRSASSSATRTEKLWAVDAGGAKPRHGCLVAVRGQFDAEGAPVTNPIKDLKTQGLWDEASRKAVNDALAASKRYPVTLLGYPEIYLEAPISYVNREVSYKEKADDKDAKQVKVADTMKLELRKLIYIKSGTTHGSDKEKKLVLEVKLAATALHDGKKESVELVNATYDFGKTKIGASIPDQQLQLKDVYASPMPMPFEEDVPIALSSGKQATGKAANLVDLRASVVITESEDGGDAERAIAKALRDKPAAFSDPIQKYVNDAIDKRFPQPSQGQGKDSNKK